MRLNEMHTWSFHQVSVLKVKQIHSARINLNWHDVFRFVQKQLFKQATKELSDVFIIYIRRSACHVLAWNRNTWATKTLKSKHFHLNVLSFSFLMGILKVRNQSWPSLFSNAPLISRCELQKFSLSFLTS